MRTFEKVDGEMVETTGGNTKAQTPNTNAAAARKQAILDAVIPGAAFTPPEGELGGAVERLYEKWKDLVELCAFMLATLELNLQRGSLSSADDAEFQKLIEGWRKRYEGDR